MSDVKQPQDRKKKSVPFTFEHGESSFTLPPASEGAAKVPGQLTRDAVMDSDNEMAQMRLGFALLEACGASQEALDAVYAKPTPEMMELLGNWMEYGDGSGATLPQS